MDLIQTAPLEYIIGGLAAAVGLTIWAVLAGAEERSVVRSSLRQLDDYEVESVRDQDLLNPLAQRAFLPVLQGLVGLGRRLTPVGYIDGVRRKFILSGNPSAEAVDRFLAIRVVTVVLVPVIFIMVYLVNPTGLVGLKQHGTFVLLGLALMLGPDAKLNRRVAERKQLLLNALPDTMDLLVISVEAGLGFEQAIDRTAGAVPGPLSQEFARMLGETRAGSSRADAMRAMEARCDVPEIRSFVLAILQADTFGVSIGRVLRSQAVEMRIKRRQAAQERAMKAPIKMMVPMVFCVFPALFVVVIGPAVIKIGQNF
ncbi:MAG: type II secretion system F family protein [Actinomycetia bacterium]|nr:type II secretion system F family protein [Actinomycetes bacterium]MCP4085142.1 type II secretion system F family protein [Actinomycetes bacterium]